MSSASTSTAHSASFLAETLQPNIYAACIIPFTLSVMAVCARFWCRWTKSAGYKIDDFLIIVALVGACIFMGSNSGPRLTRSQLAATALVGNALFSTVAPTLLPKESDRTVVIPRGLGRHIYALPSMSAANHMLWKGWFVVRSLCP